MSMLKKIFAVLIVFAVLAVLCLPVFADGVDITEADSKADTETSETAAEEIRSPAATTETDTKAKEDVKNISQYDGTSYVNGTDVDYEAIIRDFIAMVEQSKQDEAVTFWERVKSWAYAHSTDLIMAGVGIILGIVGLFGKKWISEINKFVHQILNKQANVEQSTEKSVKGYNEMVSAYEDMQKAITSKKETDRALDVTVGTLLKVLKYNTEVVRQVYLNARNTPQYLKDAINESYYSLKKSMTPDEEKAFDAIGQALKVEVPEDEEDGNEKENENGEGDGV